jgi:hypothetical protein
VHTTKARIIAASVSVVIVAGAMVALAGLGGGQSRPDTANQAIAAAEGTEQAPPTTDRSPAAATTAATGAQVQQVLVGLLAEMRATLTPADGQMKAQTPAEIEGRLRAELAKIGLHP